MYVSVSMWTHRISGFLIFVAVFTLAMLTFKDNKWSLNEGLHPALGLTVVCIMSALTIGGITTRLLLERTRWNTALALRIKTGHKFFGYLTLLISQINIYFGGQAYSTNKAESLVLAELIVFFVLIALFETFFQLYRRKEQPFRPITDTISRTEFDARVNGGEQLLLLDDMVLDVSKFKSEHPGGQFLIDFHIGRDVSKFFYGGYVLEN